MSFRRTAVLAALVVALAAMPAPSMPRAAAQSDRQRFTEDFTIPSPCVGGLVVSGTANFFVVTTTRVDKNGVAHVNVNAFADGAATDTGGGSYNFNYFNHSSVDIPPAGFPQQVRFTDHFNLNGKGKAAHMHVGFALVITVTGPGENDFFIDRVLNLRGDPDCDPI